MPDTCDPAVCEHKDGPRLCCKHGRGPNAERVRGPHAMSKTTSTEDTRLASANSTCRRMGETYAMGVGRARERADILDFIRYPPGSLPPHVRGSMAELANAIAAGRHSGDAERLYEPTEPDAEHANLLAEVIRLRARVRVEAEDVVRARVKRAHVEAWLAANGWETLTHEDGWLSFVAPDGPHVDVHLRDWSSAQAVGALARLTRRAGLDILDEMAAMPGAKPRVVAEAFGRPRKSVYKLAQGMHPTAAPCKCSPYDDDEIASALKLRADGASTREVAIALARSTKSIEKLFGRLRKQGSQP
jgi:hypothetical protein